MSHIEKICKIWKKLKIWKIIKFIEKLIKYHSEDEIKASEEFKEKHPTHRGLPVGNQVDGLPTELRNTGAVWSARPYRLRLSGLNVALTEHSISKILTGWKFPHRKWRYLYKASNPLSVIENGLKKSRDLFGSVVFKMIKNDEKFEKFEQIMLKRY